MRCPQTVTSMLEPGLVLVITMIHTTGRLIQLLLLSLFQLLSLHPPPRVMAAVHGRTLGPRLELDCSCAEAGQSGLSRRHHDGYELKSLCPNAEIILFILFKLALSCKIKVPQLHWHYRHHDPGNRKCIQNYHRPKQAQRYCPKFPSYFFQDAHGYFIDTFCLIHTHTHILFLPPQSRQPFQKLPASSASRCATRSTPSTAIKFDTGPLNVLPRSSRASQLSIFSRH